MDRLRQDHREETLRGQALSETNAELRKRIASADSDKTGLMSELESLRDEVRDARSRAQQATVARESQAVEYERQIGKLKAGTGLAAPCPALPPP